ncbi:tryptophan synthase subunit alpha [Anaerolinea sp.]|uniref:tryptophan synthase subunit alpha n=1 Tax=Anaerolinea sp. TaxID=1872519 RepID=UPI002ACE5B83|nr:tryptophan synthase subunit alpha [Anaerolinea sp.]
MSGIKRIAQIFEKARNQQRAALILYYPAGYPDYATSLEVLKGLAQSGADLLEVGMPFSDPLADGPTIQHATQVALSQRMNTRHCLALVRELRQQGVETPVVLMGYLNPVMAYGMERFVRDARQTGADGIILPDFPPEESADFRALCDAYELALISLVSPATPPERARQIAETTRGFLYLISLTGVTGARESLPPELEAFVARTRAVARVPLAVGFGISTPQQARRVSQIADGVIIGSALIAQTGEAANPVQAAVGFIQKMFTALGKEELPRSESL